MDIERLKYYDLIYQEEPHATRRKLILAKYPQIKSLMRPRGDSSTAWMSVLWLAVHYAFGYFVYVRMTGNDALLKAFLGVPGSFFASYLTLAIHEASHSTAFGPTRLAWNKCFGVLLSAMCGVPMYAFFRKHHLRHHKYQGELGVDIEPPSDTELEVFDRNPPGRLMHLFLSPALQVLRSAFSRDVLSSQKASLEHLNNLAGAVFAVICIAVFGKSDGAWFLVYLYWSHFIALGIGIVGTWGALVHAEFFDGWATINYHGYLNPYMLNFGYHYEHHDFPSIPARLLPKIREIAPEFYEDVPQLYDFFGSLVLLGHLFGLRRLRRASAKIQELAKVEDSKTKKAK